MDRGVRHFVRRILGIHLLLLALLLAVVTIAAQYVYESAREQALVQAKERQTLLAAQTAHGITGFYDSILGDLNLAKPDDEEASDLPDLPEQGNDPRLMQSAVIDRLLARQLKSRARLYLLDDQMQVRLLGGEDRPLKGNGQPRRGSAATPATGPSPEFEREVFAHFGPWLKTVKDPSISELALIGDRAIKLVSVPISLPPRMVQGKFQQRKGWLVAAVSAKPVEQKFLTDLTQPGESSQDNASGAFLVDESLSIMAASTTNSASIGSSGHELVGTRLNTHAAPELVALMESTPFDPAKSYTGSINTRFRIGKETFEPAIVNACPVEVLGKRWFVLVASPLKDVDGVVRNLAKKALGWAIFVALSMTAILVSTAAQLILNRMKMDRVRHQTLQNEMRQARQIQLAWLPAKTKTLCGSSAVEIASLNRPASHVSGDFYNFFELPDGRTAVVIGDVTGHGMAAAFLMATTQLLIRNTLPQYCDPGPCLEDVNHQLTNQVFSGQFVTMQILLIDPRTGDVQIATAGHPAPLISEGDAFHPIKVEPQLVAGVDSLTQYPTERFRLRPGQGLLLYTDGVVETENPAGNCLRLEGLQAALAGSVESAESMLQKAVSAVHTFRRGRDLIDDLTMVAIRFRAYAKPTVKAQIAGGEPEAVHAVR